MTKVYLRIAALVTIAIAILVASPTIAKEKSQKAESSPQITQPKTNQNVMVVSIVATKDNRAERLEKYFAKYGSPFAGKAQNFIDVADKYSFDWTLLPAITHLESQLGKAIPAYSYNAYGWNNGKYRFVSWEAANEVVGKALRTRYAPSGEITPWRIGRMYAESPTWAERVSRYQKAILAI